VIRSIHFYDLLDCLAGQFFNSEANSARCSGKEFGLQISHAAQEYFSVAIVPKELPRDRVVLGVLSDDSAKIVSRNGHTFTIYIDVQEIKRRFVNPIAFNLTSLIIIAHEICHFAYYYELFIGIGDNTGSRLQNIFKYQISEKLIDAVIEEEDSTSQNNIDEHDIAELVETFGMYGRNHFTKGGGTLINYHDFFHDFLIHLGYNEMFDELIKSSQ
jgi:hypothetical protein